MSNNESLLLEDFLKEDVQPILLDVKEKLSLDYLDSKIYKKDGETVLEVHIDKNFSISIDEIEKFTNLVNEKLDLIEDKIGPYMLDISSPSNERTIKFDELNHFVDKYLDIKLEKEDLVDVKLLELNKDNIKVRYFIKGRKKELILPKEDIIEIHASYKS